MLRGINFPIILLIPFYLLVYIRLIFKHDKQQEIVDQYNALILSTTKVCKKCPLKDKGPTKPKPTSKTKDKTKKTKKAGKVKGDKTKELTDTKSTSTTNKTPKTTVKEIQ